MGKSYLVSVNRLKKVRLMLLFIGQDCYKKFLCYDVAFFPRNGYYLLVKINGEFFLCFVYLQYIRNSFPKHKRTRFSVYQLMTYESKSLVSDTKSSIDRELFVLTPFLFARAKPKTYNFSETTLTKKQSIFGTPEPSVHFFANKMKLLRK